jgi:probable HAF family extracellular repeat protein
VGFSSDCPQSYAHAVIWQHGTVTDMGNVGGSYNAALFINSKGEVVGQANTPGNASLTSFYWREGSVMIDLGMLPGDKSSSAYFIDDQGVVGGLSCDLSGNNCRAYIWREGVMTDLNTLVKPGSTPLHLGVAGDINSRGEIVTYAFNPSTGAFRAAVAIPCDEQHADNIGCADVAQTTAALSQPSERPKVILPENLRRMLRQRLGFAAFRSAPVGPQ